MILLIACIVGVIVFSLLENFSSYGDYSLGIIICAMLGFFVLIAFIACPIEGNSNIHQFNAVRATIEAARTDGMELELVANQQTVAEMNAWLASVQYQNTLFIIGDFIPDAVDTLEPIR